MSLRAMLDFGQLVRLRCVCGREYLGRPLAIVHDHGRGPDYCDACHDSAYGSDVCPECSYQARQQAEDGAVDIVTMVARVTDEAERLRSIGRMDGYVLRHLAHLASRGAYAQGPTTLADTQELEVVA